MFSSLLQLNSSLRQSIVKTAVVKNRAVVAFLSTNKPNPTITAPAVAASKKPAPLAIPTPPTLSIPDEDEVNPITERSEMMTKMSSHLIYYDEEMEKKYLPAPVLPEKLSDFSALDSSDAAFHHVRDDGERRTVWVRQMESTPKQAPLNMESVWRIHFTNDGSASERWDNPLMGWTSNADPFHTVDKLTFETAMSAVYFCKKNNWDYFVFPPILRPVRYDNVQYQDNFLSQAVVRRIKKEGIRITEWERSFSGTSHYFRPLNYHGTALVPQHGPSGSTEPIAAHVGSEYKRR